VARHTLTHGYHPFGAILVGEVLLEVEYARMTAPRTPNGC
jgi:hypothetical protein